MKALWISIVASLLLLCLAQPAESKLHVKIFVSVGEDDGSKVGNALQEGMAARLNSTERYTVTDDPAATDLLLAVYCIVTGNRGGEKYGTVCFSAVAYYPFSGFPLSTHVEGAERMAAAGLEHNDLSFLIDTLVNHFINGTTHAELAEQKKMMREGIQLLCALKPAECAAPAK